MKNIISVKKRVKRGCHKIVSKEKIEHIYIYFVDYKWQETRTLLDK